MKIIVILEIWRHLYYITYKQNTSIYSLYPFPVNMNVLPPRQLSKSKLSTYLRTQCDRHLYLSLFKNNPTDLAAANLPIPLKTRPAVQLITKSGQDFERDQFDILTKALSQNVIFEQGYAPVNLDNALSTAQAPCFILQPAIEPEDFRDYVLTNFGLTQNEKSLIPQISGLRPDILYIHKPTKNDYEVLPDGTRKLVSSGDLRLAISVIDLKNVTEANASYAAEVCLYAFFLANWLNSKGGQYKDKYYVSHKVYLWKHIEMPNFGKILGLQTGSTPLKRIAALEIDLKDGLVDYMIYIPSVRKFFKDDIPRVVSKGDTEGWSAVEYHVSAKCGACDWLGNKDWLWGEDLDIYNSNPTHYCLTAAESVDHLCKMPSLSKGASSVLMKGGHKAISNLVGIASNTQILKKHSLLKSDKSQIGERARSINTGVVTLDPTANFVGLASYINAEFDIVVNFDSGSGFLTGIAIRGIVFAPPGQSFTKVDGAIATFQSFGEEAFVVGKDFYDAEWAALEAFIRKFSSWIHTAEENFRRSTLGKVHTQISFWEPRQYEELCNAFGRHLLQVLSLSNRLERALAWIFPADELMEKDEQLTPGIVFIKEIIEQATRLPVKFANTLLGVAEMYHNPNMAPRRVDNYYRELLGNAIPRERIFEIWKCSTGVIKMYGRSISLLEATQNYANTLKAHAWALASITSRLRSDLKGRLHSKAPSLILSIPPGANSVAFDSKLWIRWDEVGAATAKTESELDYITKAEKLEAGYKAIILPQIIQDFGSYKYEFEVSDDSTESKLEEGKGYYVVGLVNHPGFPLKNGHSLGIPVNPPDIDFGKLRIRLNKIIVATLEKFDRINKRAIISLRARSPYVEELFNEIMSRGLLPLNSEPIYLQEGPPYDDSDTTKNILKEVGNPSCAIIADEARAAMGDKASRKIAKGTDANTPLARVLWEADVLSNTNIRNDAEAQNISTYAPPGRVFGLNQSQQNAVFGCAQKQLSIIWGPPGTGKTDTLSFMLQSLIHEAQNVNKSRKILITGPNYRAVEELTERLLKNLEEDLSCVSDMFFIYSSGRDPKQISTTKSHLNTHVVQMQTNSYALKAQELRNSFGNQNKVTIVATTAHMVGKVITEIYGQGAQQLQEMFDFIIIDESSQVPLTLALRPLSVLKSSGQLVIAGDHLQMPPILSLEPPKNAEYLVGSIQTYLLKRFGIKSQELLVNYRSNQDIVDFAKSLDYPEQLTAFSPGRKLECIKDLAQVIASLPSRLPKTIGYRELLLPERKVTALIHDDVISSQANEIEANLVAALAYCLRHSMSKKLNEGRAGEIFDPFTDDEFFKSGIGVVTPHKAQKALVVKELMSLFPGATPELIYEAVDTVERFQGGERDTVIVSFGVGDVDIIQGEEEFLLQMERTNVAISRAKAKCIVLMPKALAYHLPSDAKAALTSRAIKSYTEEFCVNRLKITIDYASEAKSAEIRWH